MDFTTSIKTNGRNRTICKGTVEWGNREIEISYEEPPTGIDVRYNCNIGDYYDYSTLSTHEDGFPVWPQTRTQWNLTEKPDDGVFIEPVHDAEDWDGRDLYSGSNLTEVAQEHFHNIDFDQLIRKSEARMDELSQAISDDGSSSDSDTRVYDE